MLTAIPFPGSHSYNVNIVDELPEWAIDDMGAGDEGGTFDGDGAFHSYKDADKDKLKSSSQHNGDTAKRDRRQVMLVGIVLSLCIVDVSGFKSVLNALRNVRKANCSFSLKDNYLSVYLFVLIY